MGHLLRGRLVPNPRRIRYTPPVWAPTSHIASAPSIRRFTGGWGWGNEKSKAKDFLRDKQGFNF
jgi:hypothetical protein